VRAPISLRVVKGSLAEIRQAVDAVAATFNGRGSTVREREFELAFEAALRSQGMRPLRQVRLDLAEAWSGQVGGVDLALESGKGSLELIELKWDRTTLAACAWDAVKLACALQTGQGARGFLVAGSPLGDEPIRADTLLEDCELEPVGLRREYAAEFDYWRADVKNHPLQVPAGWAVRKRHSAEFRFKGDPWRIRVAEIEVEGDRMVKFE
jgi:hypothetical protein